MHCSTVVIIIYILYQIIWHFREQTLIHIFKNTSENKSALP